MPKEVKEFKEFMEYFTNASSRGDEGKNAKKNRPKNFFKKKLTVKRNKKITKFKLRTKKYLLTFKTKDGKIVKTILNNLPSSIEKVEIKNKKRKDKSRK